MNTVLLDPNDVLFFRDGRPMTGSLAGHGAVWPLPTVANAALHAALWQSPELPRHAHDHRNGKTRLIEGGRVFGSLATAGPFPVNDPGAEREPLWYFPRPQDLLEDSLVPTLRPASGNWKEESSLPSSLTYAVSPPRANRLGKVTRAKAWLSKEAYERYLAGAAPQEIAPHEAIDDNEFFDSEASIGIGIDPECQTQDGTRIYSARYLRLRDAWRLGVLAATSEKVGDDGREDLIPRLLPSGKQLVLGGQQRSCRARCFEKLSKLPLPRGRTHFEPGLGSTFRIKWVLLSPAIFPSCGAHPGGWLPSWIDTSGAVQLRSNVDGECERGPRESREAWRERVKNLKAIDAKLVAALVPKPIPITGWSLGNATLGKDGNEGAKSTHLAVPAGAIYYFETENSDAAVDLAAALNWHGSGDGAEIVNRRSTLLGEKGFGLGACGAWELSSES